MKSLVLRIVFLTVFLCVSHGVVRGHNRSESYSQWQFQDTQLRGSISIPLRLYSLLVPFFQQNGQVVFTVLAKEARSKFHWTRDGKACEIQQAPVVLKHIHARRVEIHLNYTCAPTGDLVMENRGFLSQTQGHIHIARFSETGNYWHEHIFSTSGAASQRWDLPLNRAPQNASGTLLTWISNGVEHIASGLDHIAFLAALLLWIRTWRSLLLLITGFSIGHSISLIASVLGHITPNEATIQPLIGFTIAFAASEKIAHRYRYEGQHLWLVGILLVGTASIHKLLNIHQPGFQLLIGLAIFLICYLQLSNRYPIRRAALLGLITLFFGIIHGFGFAGSLTGTVLPSQHKLVALIGFNLGVEVGQLLILLVVISTVYAIRPFITGLYDTINQLVASLLCGIGTYWCILRLYG